MKIIVELDRNKTNIANLDFKYLSIFVFMKKCRIPSDLDSESVPSLVLS